MLRDEAVCCETRAGHPTLSHLVLSFFALASELRYVGSMLVMGNVWLWLQYLVAGTLQTLSSRLFSFGGLIEDPGRLH